MTNDTADMVTLIGIKADRSEHVLGTATMPPKMKARELVREMLGEPDEDAGNDAALALWCCEQLIEWMNRPGNPRIALVTPHSPLARPTLGVYAASRASVPERPAMWRALRDQGWEIVSSWIDESGPGETADFGELWKRIGTEIARSAGVLLYAEPQDLPLKGALVEVGIAIGLGKPVAVVTPGMTLAPRDFQPLGSWSKHPLVHHFTNLEDARCWLVSRDPTLPSTTHPKGPLTQ